MTLAVRSVLSSEVQVVTGEEDEQTLKQVRSLASTQVPIQHAH